MGERFLAVLVRSECERSGGAFAVILTVLTSACALKQEPFDQVDVEQELPAGAEARQAVALSLLAEPSGSDSNAASRMPQWP